MLCVKPRNELRATSRISRKQARNVKSSAGKDGSPQPKKAEIGSHGDGLVTQERQCGRRMRNARDEDTPSVV